MFTPSQIEGIPVKLESKFKQLEARIMADLIRKLQQNGGEITRAADWQIHRLYELGTSKSTIQSIIKKVLQFSDTQLASIFGSVIESGYAYDESLYTAAGVDFIPFEENEQLQQLIGAIQEQTKDELVNITQSMGFAIKDVDGSITFQPIAKYYQNTLDKAMLDITSGGLDYGKVLKRTVKEMTNSGLRTVDYASGWSNRVTVAVRRAVVTGFNQVVAKINEDNAKKLGTDMYEVSWHSGHRPSHWWGGKWYTYEQLESICGLGEVDGLCGANCYHSYTPVIPGVSTPTYTDEELEKLEAAEKEKQEYDGKKYTKYEALQRQRRIETRLRKQREDIQLLIEGKASQDDIDAEKTKYHALANEYVEFSEAMGLPEQMERVTMDGLKGIDVSFGN